MSASNRKLLFLVNTPEFFVSHRLPLAVAAKKKGYEVHVASGNGAAVKSIEAQGFTHHVIEFSRSGQNPLVELKTLIQIFSLFKGLRPKIVHLVTIKPVLYGGIAARCFRVEGTVSAISGLGTVFVASSTMARVRRWLVTRLYLSAFKQNRLAVIFQNADDRDTLLATGALAESQVRMIRGSGVNLSHYPHIPEPNDTPVVVMAARLLRDKGVFEFIEAARILVGRGVNVQMKLIGSTDPGNLSSVTKEDLSKWITESVVEVLGHRSDIAEQYAAANIVCLPSFYGEGLPKCLVEAAAAGRAVVTTDHPGCRDAIIPGQTGLLIPVKDPVALADAIQKLIEAPELRSGMGKAGRALAEDAFALEKIVAQHLQIYREVLGDE